MSLALATPRDAPAPVYPPRAWFNKPKLSRPTPLTVTDDGQVYGHAWEWGTCHIGLTGACIIAPHSKTDYARFHLGEIRTAESERVQIGKITLDTGHAGLKLDAMAAAAHYDNTGTVAAFVRVGEDEFGGWMAGSVRSRCDPAVVQDLMASPVSGDWRNVNGNLELVGLLAVNIPGYPVPRPRALVAAGAPDGDDPRLSLVGAGVILRPKMSERDADRQIALLAARAEGLDALVALAES